MHHYLLFDMRDRISGGINWRYWWKRINTIDDGKVVIYDLFPNLTMISAILTSNNTTGKKHCYVLSLFNPIKLHIKPVNCNQQFLKSFICEKHVTINTISSPIITEASERYGLLKCPNEQYISTLYLCDGHNDCPDGTDELNCYCFINDKTINDSVYCSKKCFLSDKCTCSELFTNKKSSGCIGYEKEIHVNQIHQLYNLNESLLLYSCQNSTLKIALNLVNDLIFDCPYQDDEPELLTIGTMKAMTCTEKHMYECYPGHSRCYTDDQKCMYNL